MLMSITVMLNDEGKLDVDVEGEPPLLAVIGTLEAAKTMLLTGDLSTTRDPEPEEVEPSDEQ